MYREIKGRLFIRPVGEGKTAKAIIVGVISYPPNTDIKGEHLYDFIGEETPGGHLVINTTGPGQTAKELEAKEGAEITGNGIDGILRETIWRTEQ